MVLERIRPEDLKEDSWYYGVQCDCGRRVTVHEDLFRGRGADFLELPEEAAVACECGTRLTTKQLEKYKHSRHRV